MINRLLKLANRLDNIGQSMVADKVDEIAKKAVELSPEREKEIEESWEKYYADPEKQERNQIEQEYGIGVFTPEDAPDYEDRAFFGLEPSPWHGHKWSYEGYPSDKAGHFKKFERYQTVIADSADLPKTIDDPVEGGVWEREQVFDKPEGATKGKYQVVYRFVDNKELAKRKETVDPELQRFLDKLDKEEIEAVEKPEDIVEVEEEKPHGGGTKLF